MTIPKAKHSQAGLHGESGRWYWVDGEKYISVTTVLSGLPGKLFGLLSWSKRLVAKEAAAAIKDEATLERLRDLSAEEIVEEFYSAPDKVREKAGLRGSLVHRAVEALVANKPMFSMTVAEKGYLTAARSFMHDFDVEWVEQEMTVYSQEYRCAGTCDGLIRSSHLSALLHLPPESLYVLDWKTGQVYPEAAMQLTAYARMLQEAGKEVMGGIVVKLQETGAYDVYFTDLPEWAWEMFLKALDLSDWNRRKYSMFAKYNHRIEQFT